MAICCDGHKSCGQMSDGRMSSGAMSVGQMFENILHMAGYCLNLGVLLFS